MLPRLSIAMFLRQRLTADPVIGQCAECQAPVKKCPKILLNNAIGLSPTDLSQNLLQTLVFVLITPLGLVQQTFLILNRMYAKRYAYCISPSGPLTKPFAHIFATGIGGFANGLLYYPTPCRNRTSAPSMSTIVKLTVLLHQPGKLNDKLCLSFICDEAQYQPCINQPLPPNLEVVVGVG